MNDLRTWYITTYHDRFFVTPPAWFNAYMWMEAVYHLPLSVWAVRALLQGKCFIFYMLCLFKLVVVKVLWQRSCLHYNEVWVGAC